MTTLPQIPGVTLALDTTGEFPHLTVTGQAVNKATAAACHALAGDLGATITFDVPRLAYRSASATRRR